MKVVEMVVTRVGWMAEKMAGTRVGSMVAMRATMSAVMKAD